MSGDCDECFAGPVPGADFPWSTNENGAEDWNYCVIERCDLCGAFAGDEAAGLAVCEALNRFSYIGIQMPGPGQRFVPVLICGVRGKDTYNVALGLQKLDGSVELVNCKDAAVYKQQLLKALL